MQLSIVPMHPERAAFLPSGYTGSIGPGQKSSLICPLLYQSTAGIPWPKWVGPLPEKRSAAPPASPESPSITTFGRFSWCCSSRSMTRRAEYHTIRRVYQLGRCDLRITFSQFSANIGRTLHRIYAIHSFIHLYIASLTRPNVKDRLVTLSGHPVYLFMPLFLTDPFSSQSIV